MGIASSSAALPGEAAPARSMADASASLAPASSNAATPAFGSLERMGKPKKKKKPVLVLDPEELAKAHRMFQDGAAQQMDEFDWDGRTSAMSGLVPMGSEDVPEPAGPVPDEPEMVEADEPDPAKVLSLTQPGDRPDAERVDSEGGRPGKRMALDPARLAEDPDIIPLAESAPDRPGSAPATQFISERADMTPNLADQRAPGAAHKAEPIPDNTDSRIVAPVSPGTAARPAANRPNSETANDGGISPHADAAPPPAPHHDPDRPAESRLEGGEQRAPEYEEFAEDDLDGYAFMRDEPSQRVSTAGMTEASRNNLRARLVHPREEAAAEKPRPSFFVRLWRSLFG